ncbi:MAG TPA: VWA domain-containing protein [Thermoanaerobaculia bacterium]|nr:VWA domain-containing protein [Thermoanaerobaculia bacterium]
MREIESRGAACCVLLALLLLAAAPPLAPRHQTFLDEVAPLISEAEREVFLGLARDYQRDAFIRAFWQVRDPHRETARNELEESWKERLAQARERFGGLTDERARLLLLNGQPEQVVEAACSELLRPLEIWFYSRTDRIRESFALVFVSTTGSRKGPYRLWAPSQGLEVLAGWSGSQLDRPESLLERIEDHCPRSSDIVAGLSSAVEWQRLEARPGFLPRPGVEWLQAFTARSTTVPEGAAAFPARLELAFPGRFQSRTVVQGLIFVPADGYYVLDGEVLRGEELFERFRYRYQVRPTDRVGAEAPLVFQRQLRPGDYRLVLKVEDLERRAFFLEERAIQVPGPEALAARLATEPPPAPTEAPAPPAAGADRLAEANAGLARGEATLSLLAPPPRLLTGRFRFEAMAVGAGVARVRFELDGKPALTKAAPPYSVELDLGAAPRVRKVRAVALDAAGRELAVDEVLVNGGPHRFGIRLLEPRSRVTYGASVPARAIVEVPEGERLERVEVYWNEALAATLYQPPFAHPLLVEPPGSVGIVRAVAHLEQGGQVEDAVVVNTEGPADTIAVHLVELYTTVTDRKGRPVEDLAADRFQVLEDGVPQQVRRFERVRDQPVHAVVLLDTSSSMTEELSDAVAAAVEFFRTVLGPRDQGAVITFSERPTVAARFTSDPVLLAEGVAGIRAEGDTALYDAVIYSLFYASGIAGKKAVILLSDGEDVSSRYRYEDMVDYAHRTGVAVYTIGLALPTSQNEIRQKLGRLARETGGLSFFVDDVKELTRVYRTIETELRAQYLIAYQSTNAGRESKFREVEVRLSDPGLEAKTMRGYYP